MAGKSAQAASLRRRQVEELELRGATAAAIATALKADPRTIRRDLQSLAHQRTRSADLMAERRRLLEAAKLVEHHAWDLFDGLPAADTNGRLGALGKILASQARALQLVGDLATLELEARLTALDARFTALEHAYGQGRGRAR
jgi:hypothetical protein